MQRYERLWERLLTLLGTLGEVDAGTPGRVKVRVDRHEIEIVMTEQQWDDLVSIPYGSFGGAAGHVLRAIGRAQAEDAPRLVYDTYELHPSDTLVAPMRAEMEADQRRVMEHLRQHPDAEVRWTALRPGDEPS